MNSPKLKTLTALLLGVSLAGVAGAQQSQPQFPADRVQPGSCAGVDWNKEMVAHHPLLIDGCREVITVGGQDWARFEAKFARMEPNGDVTFSIRDSRDRSIEEVSLKPSTGQVAYIDGRATQFSALRRDQLVNLYVPEGQYGFVTQPGVPTEAVAVVTSPKAAAPTRVAAAQPQPRAATQGQPRAAMLPATAGPLPWFALGGLLSLMGGLGLTLTRKRQALR
jgi:hypothetical protein